MSKGIVVKSDDFDCASDSSVDFLFFEFHVFRTESDVLFNGVRKKLVFGVLKDHTHFKAQILERLFFGCVHAVDGNLRFLFVLNLDKSVEMLNESGFSAARRADDAHELSFFNRQIYIGKRHLFIRRLGRVDVG